MPYGPCVVDNGRSKELPVAAKSSIFEIRGTVTWSCWLVRRVFGFCRDEGVIEAIRIALSLGRCCEESCLNRGCRHLSRCANCLCTAENKWISRIKLDASDDLVISQRSLYSSVHHKHVSIVVVILQDDVLVEGLVWGVLCDLSINPHAYISFVWSLLEQWTASKQLPLGVADFI